jgi:tetratricopeptide (TPR) repeat protein
VADAILSESGELARQQAAVLAQHYYSAGEWQAAFPWWVKAMERSRQLLGYSEAAETLNFAEKILERRFENLDDELIFQLYRSWGEISQTAARYDEMQATADKLLRLGERKRSVLLQGAAYLVLTDLDLVRNQFDQGILHAKQAIAYLEKTDWPRYKLRAHTNLGVFQYLLNQFTTAISTFETVLANLPEPAGEQDLILSAAVHYHMGLVYTLNGRPRLGYEHANQALADNLAAQLLDGQVAAYSVLALAAYLLGKYPEARRASECGLEYTVRGQHPRLANYLHMYKAMVELAEGRLDTLLEHLTFLMKRISENKADETLFTNYRILGDAHLWMRDYEGAVQHYEQSCRTRGGYFLSIDHQLCCLIAHRLNAEPTGLDGQFDTLLKDCQDQGLGTAIALARLGQVRVAIHEQKWSRAEEIALDLLEITSLQEIHSVYLSVAQLLAVIDLHFGRIQPAIDRLQAILLSTRDPLNAWLEVDILCALSAAQHRAGQSTESAQQRLRNLLAKIQADSTLPNFRLALQSYFSIVQKATASFECMPW